MMRRLLACLAVLLAAALALLPSSASAHSLESSTISVHVTDAGVDATISVAVDTLDEALGTDYAHDTDPTIHADAVIAYLAEHLEVTGGDGTTWGESFSGVTRTDVEGIDSLSVDVDLDTGTSDLEGFTIAYDAIIEAVPGHEAVVVLTDADGEISTPGVISGEGDTVTIGDAAEQGAGAGTLDMVGYGFHHVLEGADHLLFLLALLLPAPLVVVAGRWRRRGEVGATARRVAAIVTSFTVGHSITLIASSLGWVSVPSALVEVLIAVSVGVAALHAIRPVVPHGEELIAGAFGLVHGLAFAGILTGLGLRSTTSLLALLAFNLGVELAQLTVTATVFPSLYLLARTHFYPAVRVGGAVLAILAALGWVVDRLGLAANPLSGVEDAVIARPWLVVAAVAGLAGAAWLVDRRTRQETVVPGRADRSLPGLDTASSGGAVEV
ncbi:MAG: HupE/UreJ family protein [Nocardioides sp.]|uniref:HupE/UreJ family protein n=1 Tax=Nocardioides sp. TaxID=35761 RepID=UPI0023829B04|nr:HupE/UreJ family protein [Nocardioides sp.]MDE0775622.1 HupE/UreJ family protein [Nocardioides sp.]